MTHTDDAYIIVVIVVRNATKRGDNGKLKLRSQYEEHLKNPSLIFT